MDRDDMNDIVYYIFWMVAIILTGGLAFYVYLIKGLLDQDDGRHY